MNKDKVRELTEDYIFKRVFGKKENEDLLKDLLESILEIKIAQIEVIIGTEIEKEKIEDKLGIIDLKATINKETTVDIEIQVKNYHNMIERSTFYIAGLYHTELNEVMTDKLELHFLELPKLIENKEEGNKRLRQWLEFIYNKRKGEIEMAVQENEKIAKAQVEYKYLTGDEKVQRLAFLRDKWESDHKSELNWEKREAEKKGRKLGERIGEAKGERRKQKEIIIKMLKENYEDDIIIKLTEIDKEELEKIKEELKK